VKSWFNPEALDVVRRESAEWKKRALIAEGKLAGYQRLRAISETIIAAVVQGDPKKRIAATNELSDELAALDVVDVPHDFYNQIVELSDELQIRVRSRAGLGHCSTLDVENSIIEVEALQPEDGKAIGLMYQCFQVADIITAQLNETEPQLQSDYLHILVPMFLSLTSALGLLHERMNITPASIEAYVTTLPNEEDREAASYADD
jgi:hypothetical protein